MNAVHGLSLFATSAGSADIYKYNSPSYFTNLLKKPIQLNTNQKYEIALTNYHIPAYEAILHGNDFEDSFIQYNIAQFNYDKTLSRYTPKSSSVKKLFRLAPRTNLNGLWDETGAAFDFNSPLNNADLDNTGVPALRAQKEAFINRLASSVVLKSHDDDDDDNDKLNSAGISQREHKLFMLFIKQLYDHPAMGTSKLDRHVTLKLIGEEGGEVRGGKFRRNSCYGYR